jgi:hypothetical protein
MDSIQRIPSTVPGVDRAVQMEAITFRDAAVRDPYRAKEGEFFNARRIKSRERQYPLTSIDGFPSPK